MQAEAAKFLIHRLRRIADGGPLAYDAIAIGEAADTIEALLAIAEASEWQPIKSAPKDGAEVWLYCEAEEPSQFAGYFADDPDGAYWAYSEQLVMDVAGAAHPTHWRPLPKAPEGLVRVVGE